MCVSPLSCFFDRMSIIHYFQMTYIVSLNFFLLVRCSRLLLVPGHAKGAHTYFVTSLDVSLHGALKLLRFQLDEVERVHCRFECVDIPMIYWLSLGSAAKTLPT